MNEEEHMPNQTQTIKGMNTNIFCRSSLILMIEGLRLLFARATGMPDRFYKAYLAFKDQKGGCILTYNQKINRYGAMSMSDALAAEAPLEERTPLRWTGDDIEERFTGKVQKLIRAIPHNCVLSRPYHISFSSDEGSVSFYAIVGFRDSQWEVRRIPQNLIRCFFSEFIQKFHFLSGEFTDDSVISEIIHEYLNPTSIIRSVCEIELKDLFGKKRVAREGELFDFICNLACKPYEGAQNNGVIRFASDSAKAVNLIRFENPISCDMDNTREIRKLLEMTDEDTPLLVRQNLVVGLGKEGAGNYSIVFEGNGKWRLYRDSKNSPIFTVEGNICTFTSSPGRDAFSTVFQEVFPDCAERSEEIKTIIDTAILQRHGTSIVICNKAQEEAVRLAEKSRAIKIVPISLAGHNRSITKMTSIDGAILLSPDGICYAIGAILDGEAVTGGDTARGARYNSLNNYVKWRTESDKTCHVMAVVISEDQTIDILP